MGGNGCKRGEGGEIFEGEPPLQHFFRREKGNYRVVASERPGGRDKRQDLEEEGPFVHNPSFGGDAMQPRNDSGAI